MVRHITYVKTVSATNHFDLDNEIEKALDDKFKWDCIDIKFFVNNNVFYASLLFNDGVST